MHMLASTLGEGGRPTDGELRVLRGKLPSLLDALVEEVRALEDRADLLQRMLDAASANAPKLSARRHGSGT